jgi:hypothetical protein
MHKDPSAGAPICRVVEKEYAHGCTTNGMSWMAPGEEPVVKTIILNDDTQAKRAAQRWAREKEPKVGAEVWMYWTDVSRSDHGKVGATAVFKHGNEWTTLCSYLDSGRMEVFGAELWAI